MVFSFSFLKHKWGEFEYIIKVNVLKMTLKIEDIKFYFSNFDVLTLLDDGQ